MTESESTPSWDSKSPRASLAERVRTDADLKRRIEATIGPYVARISESFNRATRLVESSRQFSDQSVAQDVLRAAVVLNHAYLEDMLRTLASNLLPEGNESVLNEVPLAGLGSARAEKFLLGRLAQHRGKTVDAVIIESVSEHLERSNYNDTREIAQLLTQLGFKVPDHNAEFPTIQEMIQRRHLIVHRADRVKAPDSEAYALQPIQATEVLKWLQVTAGFIQSLMQPLFLKLYPPEELAKMFNVILLK